MYLTGGCLQRRKSIQGYPVKRKETQRDSSISFTFVIRYCRPLQNENDKIYVAQTGSEINIHIRACQSPLPVASVFSAGLRSVEMTAEKRHQEER